MTLLSTIARKDLPTKIEPALLASRIRYDFEYNGILLSTAIDNNCDMYGAGPTFRTAVGELLRSIPSIRVNPRSQL